MPNSRPVPWLPTEIGCRLASGQVNSRRIDAYRAWLRLSAGTTQLWLSLPPAMYRQISAL